MKQITFIFIFVLISSALFAQNKADVVYLKNGSIIKGQITEMIPDKHIKIETSGGSLFVYTFEEIEKIEKQEITNPPTVSHVQSKTTTAKISMDNVFYFRLGYSSPSWKQFGFAEVLSDEVLSEVLSKNGAMFEMGKIYMLNSIPLPDNMVIGINADFFSIYWHQFSNNNEDGNINTLRLDSKVGPSFTYTPVDKLGIDLYVKADISWVTATVDEDDDGYGAIGTVGLSTGFNVRYSKLLLGFEFNSINPKLESIDYEGEYFGNLNDYSSKKSPLPSLTFSIGLAF
ncbi:MAG: hypothetical protein ACQERU_04430 [Bacteroidota bacterium]